MTSNKSGKDPPTSNQFHIKLTDAERRMVQLLDDGQPHSQEEMMQCLYDPEYCTLNNLKVQVHNLRAKLNRVGKSIEGRGKTYRMVRYLTSPDE